MKEILAASIGAALSARAGQHRAVGQRYALRERALAPDDLGVRTRENAGTPRFTPREREVLALLCEGLPNKRICTRLNIATGTVKVHVSSILRALGVASRLEAVIAARRQGLLEDMAPGMAARSPGAVPGQVPVSAAEQKAVGRYADAVGF